MSYTNQKIACFAAIWLRFTAAKCRNQRTTNGRLWEVLDTPLALISKAS